MKDWKTTVVGCCIGALTAVLELVQTGTVDSKTLIIVGGLAALGVLSKDAEK